VRIVEENDDSKVRVPKVVYMDFKRRTDEEAVNGSRIAFAQFLTKIRAEMEMFMEEPPTEEAEENEDN
jgi:hypothetical protein